MNKFRLLLYYALNLSLVQTAGPDYIDLLRLAATFDIIRVFTIWVIS